mmetsp:Transcript_54242/g.166887  ORF Transcript_54242/g.166887 Transcript_54242/m.166887 type:complete len:223 (+) Transcript_54242:1261-1929(+)
MRYHRLSLSSPEMAETGNVRPILIGSATFLRCPRATSYWKRNRCTTRYGGTDLIATVVEMVTSVFSQVSHDAPVVSSGFNESRMQSATSAFGVVGTVMNRNRSVFFVTAPHSPHFRLYSRLPLKSRTMASFIGRLPSDSNERKSERYSCASCCTLTSSFRASIIGSGSTDARWLRSRLANTAGMWNLSALATPSSSAAASLLPRRERSSRGQRASICVTALR